METLNVDNPVCYLNINSPSKKKTHISEISLHLPMNVLCIDQAKLDSSFFRFSILPNRIQFSSLLGRFRFSTYFGAAIPDKCLESGNESKIPINL